MKRVEAVIRPEKLEEIKEALKNKNINGITISQVMGCGQQLGWTEYFRASEIVTNVLPKIEVKMVIEDDKVEEVIDLIFKDENKLTQMKKSAALLAKKNSTKEICDTLLS